MQTTLPAAIRSVEILGVRQASRAAVRDDVVVEEPLAIRIGGAPFATIMRTPGEDRALAAGFLYAERLLTGPHDIACVQESQDADDGDGAGNVVNVWLHGEAGLRAAVAFASRRRVTAGSACGVCGRQTIDDLMRGVCPVTSAITVREAAVNAMPARLRAAQAAFDRTGGLHAAGLFEPGGSPVAVSEDVGRHNAVDKVIGRELLAGRLPVNDLVLVVSGRTSFEIVQKAAVAGIPVVASVSAPSSLAVDLARASNVTLLGFVRGDQFNVYAGAERIVP
jgi:FdhD protein